MLALFLVCVAPLGCGKPNTANIELRKQNQQLQAQIDLLNQRLAAASAEINGLRSQQGTLPSLPSERLSQLFTVQKVELGQLSGGADLDPKVPGDEALKVYLTPLDDGGDAIKAVGNVTVEAFDLSRTTDNRVGVWEFDPQKMKEAWRGFLRLQAFVLVCPWQRSVPQQNRLALKVRFTDALTGRVYEQVKDVQLTPPPPTTAPVNGRERVTGSQ